MGALYSPEKRYTREDKSKKILSLQVRLILALSNRNLWWKHSLGPVSLRAPAPRPKLEQWLSGLEVLPLRLWWKRWKNWCHPRLLESNPLELTSKPRSKLTVSPAFFTARWTWVSWAWRFSLWNTRWLSFYIKRFCQENYDYCWLGSAGRCCHLPTPLCSAHWEFLSVGVWVLEEREGLFESTFCPISNLHLFLSSMKR